MLRNDLIGWSLNFCDRLNRNLASSRSRCVLIDVIQNVKLHLHAAYTSQSRADQKSRAEKVRVTGDILRCSALTPTLAFATCIAAMPPDIITCTVAEVGDAGNCYRPLPLHYGVVDCSRTKFYVVPIQLFYGF